MTTDHFEKRVKQRTGLSKSDSEKLLEKAIRDGLTYDDCKSRPSLIKYLDKLDSLRNKSMIIYDKYIVIRSNSKVAITILSLPKEFYSTVKSLNKRKDEQYGLKVN